jgi:hypothetical protein
MKRILFVLILILVSPIASLYGDDGAIKVITGKESNIDLYKVYVAHEVHKKWKFDSALLLEPSDSCSAIFKVMPDGTIKDIRFTEQSKGRALMVSALEAIKATSPTKPIPKRLGAEYVMVEVRFSPESVR